MKRMFNRSVRIHIRYRCCKRLKTGFSPIRPQCCDVGRKISHPGVYFNLGVIAAIVEEVLDEWIARVMVHYRWHYDENALHVLSKGSGRKLQHSDLQDFEIYRWGPRACRATGTELPSQQRAAENEYIGMLESLENQLASTRYALGDRPSAVDAMLLGGLRARTGGAHTRFESI